MRSSSSHRTKQGFTIIEILIAVIIIGILVAIIIPVLLRRTEEARVASAESDLEHLQAAEERAYLNTQWLYRFYVLDDVPGGDGVYAPGNPNDIDGVRDEQYNITVTEPTRMFIDYRTGDFDTTRYASLYNRLSRDETEFGWAGPYINYQRMKVNEADLPLDPWGNEYMMFTRKGLVNMRTGVVDRFYSFIADDGSSVPLFVPFFDRTTVLSMGPNGTPGDGTPAARFGTGDDLLRQF